jgi:hypothetical protein
MNVAELKSLASDMNIKVPSKSRKADIENLIMDAIDVLHAEALEINDTRDIVKIAEAGSYLKREPKSFDERMISRINGYTIQRNGGKLTRKQLQRIGKKVRAHNG